MNLRTPFIWAHLVSRVKNPWPLFCDRIGMQKTPYILHVRHGLQMELRPGRGDLTAFRESWLREIYTEFGQDLAEGDTVIDVGANVGCFALFAAHKVGSTGRVIALEPNGETFRQLDRNIALNRLQNVQSLRMAMSGQSGMVQFHCHHDALLSSLYQTVDGHAVFGEVEEVPAITFQQLLTEQGIDHCHFLKLDCEGAEHDIVSGMTPEIASRIDRIGMELHKIEGRDPDDLVRRLQGFGFGMQRQGEVLYFYR